jgi:hypothetical protein
VAAEEAGLCAEALRLTRDLLARVRAGDEAAIPALADARALVVQRLAALDTPAVPADPRERERVEACRRSSGEAIRVVLALDREINGVLEARLRAVREELGTVREHREALLRYRGRPPAGPAYADRIG